MKLSISRIHYPVTTLGPGRRIGIWFQGCSIRCEGCISRDTWRFREGDVFPEDVMSRLDAWMDECDAITISGGEPFDQAVGLFDLLKRIKARKSTANVLVYSGYKFEQLDSHPELRTGLIDALITDPYIRDTDQTMHLRGSDNQRLHKCVFPAYDQCIKASHLFNLLDARGVISVTERQAYIGRVRALAKKCADAFVQTEAGGWQPEAVA